MGTHTRARAHTAHTLRTNMHTTHYINMASLYLQNTSLLMHCTIAHHNAEGVKPLKPVEMIYYIIVLRKLHRKPLTTHGPQYRKI